MKKALSMILVLTMVLALALPAMAAEGTVTPASGDSSKNVTADFTGETEQAKTVYYVTITWDTNNSSSLKYTGKQGVYTWDGETMKYTEDTTQTKAAKWEGTATYKVTVSNQSNAAVTASVEGTTKYGIKLTEPTTMSENLTRADDAFKSAIANAAANQTTGTASTLEATYTYDATNATEDPTKDAQSGSLLIGTITVKITHN